MWSHKVSSWWSPSTVAYGQDADLTTVKRISEASRAAAYDATDPQTIDAVFTNVLSNF
jgi:Ca-activated chloride channel homolog